jgi:hypothetical protein
MARSPSPAALSRRTPGWGSVRRAVGSFDFHPDERQTQAKSHAAGQISYGVADRGDRVGIDRGVDPGGQQTAQRRDWPPPTSAWWNMK